MSKLSIDLDALAPEVAVVTLGGEDIVVYPPTLEDVMQISRMFKKYSDLASGDIQSVSDEQVEEALSDLKVAFTSFVPELKDKKLNIRQFFALKDLVESMLSPDSFQDLIKNDAMPVGDVEKKEESSLT